MNSSTTHSRTFTSRKRKFLARCQKWPRRHNQETSPRPSKNTKNRPRLRSNGWKKCPAILGLVEEGEEIIEEFEDSPALDAGLLGAAQAVEHYEISRYGTLKAWARELGLDDAVGLLEETLEEEKDTDATLTEMAESVINQKAEAAE
jgi:ferritin-like metal-binding protein YciE